MSEAEVQVVPDSPDVVADDDQYNLDSFLEWDTLSQRIASSGQMTPPWFRQPDIDVGEVLVFTGVKDSSEDGAWEHDKARIVEITGPSRKLVKAILNGRDAAAKSAASIALVKECVVQFPDNWIARRPFKVDGKVIVEQGSPMPAPWKLGEEHPDKVVTAYIEDCIPSRVRGMIHTGALCMAVPEIEFMVQKGKEKEAEEEASIKPSVPGAPLKPAAQDPNLPGGSTGSSGQT